MLLVADQVGKHWSEPQPPKMLGACSPACASGRHLTGQSNCGAPALFGGPSGWLQLVTLVPVTVTAVPITVDAVIAVS